MWACALLCLLLALLVGLDEAHARGRHHRRRGHHRTGHTSAPKAPPGPTTKGTSDGASTPEATPDPETDPPRAGPAGPAESDLDDELGSVPDAADKDRKSRPDARVREKGAQTQVFDFGVLNLSGSERKPQLLYFLDRAQEELKRASLERRSFIPEMVKSLDEESL